MVKEHAPTGYCWVTEAANELGFTVRYVQRLCHEGKLKAKRLGTDWAVNIASVEKYKSK